MQKNYCQSFSRWWLFRGFAFALLAVTAGNLQEVAAQSAPVPAAAEPVPPAAKEAADTVDPPRPQEQARRAYLGRVVAQPMSHLGAGWLIRPTR